MQKTRLFNNKIIDVNFNFTTDCSYWDGYNNGDSDTDPDIMSPTLRLYQQILYSRKTPCGKTIILKQGKNVNYDYLVYQDNRLASDNIINMFERYNLPWSREAQIDNYNDKIKQYKLASYIIGAEILFPKHKDSINQWRGKNKQIQDRFDLTLECIKRFYDGEQNPLNETLNKDKWFFDLFVNFKGYIDFFFLNDLVSLSYKQIKFFLGNYNDVFIRPPFPQNKHEWQKLYDNQMNFLQQRTNRIKQFVTNTQKDII
jgi:hypothetical protein